MHRLAVIGLTGIAGVVAAAAIAVPAYSQVSAQASQWVCVSMKTETSYYVETRAAPHACEGGFFLTGIGEAGPAGKNGATGATGPPGKDTAGPAGLDVVSVLTMAGQGFNTVTATCPASNPYLVGGGGDAGGEILIYSAGTEAVNSGGSIQPGSWTVDRTPVPGAIATGMGITATAICAA